MSLEVSIEISEAQAIASLLPVGPSVELSVTSPAPCLPAGGHASCRDGNELNLWNLKPAPIKCLFTALKP